MFEKNSKILVRAISNRSHKIIMCLVFVLAFAMIQTGCMPPSIVVKNKNEEKTKAIELYFVAKAYLQDEESKAPLIQSKTSIDLPAEVKEESEDEQNAFVAVSALNMLKIVPKDITEFADTAVSEDTVFNKVTIKDNKAIVDIAAESLQGGGGSTEESVFISQVIETLMRTVPNVKSVKFIVDGKEAESLMGHIDIADEFTEAPIKFGTEN